MASVRGQTLAGLLEELKQRSGSSYQQIGRRTHLSKSTVHRICAGRTIPTEFSIVERIGKACQASHRELIELHGLWVTATAARADGAQLDLEPAPEADRTQPGASRPESAELASAEPAPTEPLATEPAATEPLATGPERRPHDPAEVRRSTPAARSFVSAARRVTILVLIAVVALWLPSAPTTDRLTPAASVPQVVSGPSWLQPPQAVPSTMFGATINSATGVMPSFQVGAVRFWDSRTRWVNIQGQRGHFDWTNLDRLVTGANQAKLPALFTIGGTPPWAAPAGPRAPYDDGSRAAPPDDMADWDAFVGALASRYRGRIEAYEVWVLGNDPRFYSGSVEKLVEMTLRASRIIKSRDPEASVVCPGMGRLWTTDGQRLLRRFAELGGYHACDAASIKLHQRSPADPPETMLQLIDSVDRMFHGAGVHPPLWNTGTTYEISLQGSLDQATAVNHAVRFFLVGLYARKAGLARMYFYNWGGTRIPIVLQAEGGTPTPAALAIHQLQQWLRDAQISSCGRGRAIGLPDTVWQCEFTVTRPGRSFPVALRWTHSGTAETTAGPGSVAVHRLDGTSRDVRPGDTILATEQPVLLESASTST